jgi:hypothetical protein
MKTLVSSSAERTVLRDLARQVMDIAGRPDQEAKRKRWIAHNGLRDPVPLICCFPEGSWLECIPNSTLQCTTPLLRGWEKRMRMALFVHDVLQDDQVVDPVFNITVDVRGGGWGISETIRMAEGDRELWAPENLYYLHHALDVTLPSRLHVGAYHSDPPLKNPEDIEKLVPGRVTFNAAASQSWLDTARDLFGDILPVRQRAWFWTGCSPGADAVQLRGMERLMLDVYDRPEWVHRLVRFLCENTAVRLDRLEAEGRLHLNNESEWVGTGGIGYSDELPAPCFDPAHVRLRDIWGLSQGQDLVSFSPAMIEEFFVPYLVPVMARFGLNCYGCCEPMHDKIAVVRKIPNLRRLSISPWADVKSCAEQLGDSVVFSWKPNPASLSTERVDEAAIRRELVESLTVTRRNGCIVEVLMKDLHTVQGDPRRLSRWVELAKQARAEVYG